ncbi:ABC transporter permease [Acuticoccus sediminis]|uniref:ABC transporter permease n=1 Tax=Acuticoccus sediminis TaxID=2184697 RepID=A0A8B2NIM6_9HYPH|nr:ABC transporter permease [Acuticoccus sediminis]RAH99384.1 ABC transporter permease [Acuticoccus sediminis]
MNERGRRYYVLAGIFTLFVLFLYGPMFAIFALSFQGPEGGLTFPMRGFSTHWFSELWKGVGVVDIWAAFGRSLRLGAVVSALTLVISLPAALAYRIGFRGATLLFYTVIASLIVPSIVVSLGIGLEFRLFDDWVKEFIVGHQTSTGLFSSALGAHLTWTLPFGLLILLAAFNRFDRRYEEAARDLGASPWQTLWLVILPIILPSLIGIGLFGFTLSWDELARTSQAIGGRNTLPLELRGLTQTVTTPAVYALGTVVTGVSLVVIGFSLATITLIGRARSRRGR